MHSYLPTYKHTLFLTDMIFLRFKAEFRYPECPIPLNFITIRFFCKVRVRARFRILQCRVCFLLPKRLGTTFNEEITQR